MAAPCDAGALWAQVQLLWQRACRLLALLLQACKPASAHGAFQVLHSLQPSRLTPAG